MDSKKLRIVFMGTPEFAVTSLQFLFEEGYNIVGVVTAPDKPAGRGQQMAQSAVKLFALAHNLQVLQPEKLKDPAFLDELNALKPDIQVVVAFRMLPQQVWELPPLGTFNLHASLLPKYRGAAPINRAIMNGEKETGATTFLLKHEIDTGNIVLQEKIAIADEDDAETVHDALMVMGARLVVQTIDLLAGGNTPTLSQEELIGKGIEPTPAPKIFKEDCLIDWKQPCEKIRNLIRGLSPYPAAWTHLYHKNEKLNTTAKIYKVRFEAGEAIPGKIVTDSKQALRIGCPDGWLHILEIQLAGKKRMPAEEFLRGFKTIEEYRTV